MKRSDRRHDVGFYDLPARSVETTGEAVRARGFVLRHILDDRPDLSSDMGASSADNSSPGSSMACRFMVDVLVPCPIRYYSNPRRLLPSPHVM